MYVCAEGNTGRFFKGWGEISRGIWGRWIWMGSLLLESTADREVNSSWPGEGRRGRGGGDWLMHALAYIWGLTLYRSLCVTHSPSLRTIYHYSFTSFCCCNVKLLLLDNLVDYDNEVRLSIHARGLADRPRSCWFLRVEAAFLRMVKSVQVLGFTNMDWQLLHQSSSVLLWGLIKSQFSCLQLHALFFCPLVMLTIRPVTCCSQTSDPLLFSFSPVSSLLLTDPARLSGWPTRRPRPSRSESTCLTHNVTVCSCVCKHVAWYG